MAECEESGLEMALNRSHPCEYCRHSILFMRTYLGQPYAFEAEVFPRELDVEQAGWAPGLWPLRGRARCVLAPIHLYDDKKRRRIAHVLLLHSCPGRRGRVLELETAVA